MHPGTLVPNVDHFKKIFVNPGAGEGILKERFMGFGRTGRYYHPVKPFLLDHLPHLVLGILGTTEHILLGKYYAGQTLCKLHHRRNIHNAGDVGAAAAYENTDTRCIPSNIPFLRNLSLPGQRPAGLGKETAGHPCRRTGIHH